MSPSKSFMVFLRFFLGDSKTEILHRFFKEILAEIFEKKKSDEFREKFREEPIMSNFCNGDGICEEIYKGNIGRSYS